MSVVAKKFIPEALPDKSSDEVDSLPVSPKQVLSMVRAITPVIHAMIINPGSDARADIKAGAIISMVKSAHDSSAMLMKELMPDLSKTPWARSEMFSFCTNIIAKEWLSSPEQNASSNIIDEAFVSTIRESLTKTHADSLAWMEKVGEYPPIVSNSDAASRIRVSVMKASQPMVMEMNRFAFWQSEKIKPSFISDCIEKIVEVAASHANKIADEYSMTPEFRITLWQGDINRAFLFAIEEYKRKSTQAIESIESIDKSNTTLISAKKFEWYQTAKSGTLINEIAERVSDNFLIMDGVANKICTTLAKLESNPSEKNKGKPYA